MPTASESPTKPPPALLSLTKGESLFFFLVFRFFSAGELLFCVSFCFVSLSLLSLPIQLLLPGLEVVAQVLDLEDLLGGCYGNFRC